MILPQGVLDTIERHIVGVAEQAGRLRAHGQHLKRGLLLHGPPGTGKTHTVRYLMGRMRDCTVIVMTGAAIRFVSQAAGLARRLQPAIVVLEDVDLVARDRSYNPGGNPLLFALLDAMDGVGADADVTFVLTTNRADVLERALADPERVVARTEGATASFFKELLRRAVLSALRGGDETPVLTDEHVGRALEEMLGEREPGPDDGDDGNAGEAVPGIAAGPPASGSYVSSLHLW